MSSVSNKEENKQSVARETRVLGLIFTKGMSLEQWQKQGLLEREKAIYEYHLNNGHFDKVVWFTAGQNDLSIRDNLVLTGILDQRIEVYNSQDVTRIKAYIKHTPLTIIKSNQLEGAFTAYRISKYCNIPFEFRTGYTYSMFHTKKHENESVWNRFKRNTWLRYYSALERYLYERSKLSVVSSRHDKEYLCNNLGVKENKIEILTNYIDTNKFVNHVSISDRKERFLFVGRMSDQKNMFSILKAFDGMDVGIDIYGDGEQKQELEVLVADNTGIDAHFCGVVSNDELPRIYNEYKYYILCSKYEGMPKTLLEAMSCGCICVGSKVEGIEETIIDGDNGLLSETIDTEQIRLTIAKAISMSQSQKKSISRHAEAYICYNHSLKAVGDKEWELQKNLIEN